MTFTLEDRDEQEAWQSWDDAATVSPNASEPPSAPSPPAVRHSSQEVDEERGGTLLLCLLVELHCAWAYSPSSQIPEAEPERTQEVRRPALMPSLVRYHAWGFYLG